MRLYTIEEVQEFEKWSDKLHKLNDHINSLTIWNDYAESCQRDYDNLLKQDPRLKSEIK